VGQHVHPDDVQLHVNYYETPRDIAAQTYVQGLGFPSVCGDGGRVGSVEGVICRLPAPRQELMWEDANVGTDVYQKLLLCDSAVMKRRPELVVQTLAAVNERCWHFPAGGRLPASVGPSAGLSTVDWTFGIGPKFQWYQQKLWGV
jgi:hypothetical protein